MIRVMIASGIEPSAIAGRIRWRSASQNASKSSDRSESIRMKFVCNSMPIRGSIRPLAGSQCSWAAKMNCSV